MPPETFPLIARLGNRITPLDGWKAAQTSSGRGQGRRHCGRVQPPHHPQRGRRRRHDRPHVPRADCDSAATRRAPRFPNYFRLVRDVRVWLACSVMNSDTTLDAVWFLECLLQDKVERLRTSHRPTSPARSARAPKRSSPIPVTTNTCVSVRAVNTPGT